MTLPHRTLVMLGILPLWGCLAPPAAAPQPEHLLAQPSPPDGWFLHLLGGTLAAADAVAVEVEVVALLDAPTGSPLETNSRAVLGDRNPVFRTVPHHRRGLLTLDATAAAGFGTTAATATRQVVGRCAATIPAATPVRIVGSTRLPPLLFGRGRDGLFVAVGDLGTDLLVPQEPLPTDGTPWVLLCPPSTTAAGWLAVVVRRSQESRAAPPPPVAPAPAAPTAATPWTLARQAIGAEQRRPALLALARDAGANELVELLLGAEPPLLAAIARNLPPTPEPPAKWAFPRVAYTTLAEFLQRDALDAAERALAGLAVGALVEDPAELQDLAAGVDEAPAFAAALLAANRDALHDRAPWSRWLAHRWLLARGAEVPGFDPLGKPELRAAALARANPEVR